MKVDLDKLVACLKKLEENYKEIHGPKFNKGPDFDKGYLYCLAYICKYIIPAIEEFETIDRADKLLALQEELAEMNDIINDLERRIKETEDDE